MQLHITAAHATRRRFLSAINHASQGAYKRSVAVADLSERRRIMQSHRLGLFQRLQRTIALREAKALILQCFVRASLARWHATLARRCACFVVAMAWRDGGAAWMWFSALRSLRMTR